MGYSDDYDLGPIGWIFLFILFAILIGWAIVNEQNCLQKSCKVGEPMVAYGGKCICAEIPK